MAIDDATWATILDAAARHLADEGAPGLAIAVAGTEGAPEVRCVGTADVASGTDVRPDHVFQIGSIGKSFAALIAVQLQEAGTLDLHAPVTDVLPWFEVRSAFDPITIHHLLTHTGGIAGGSLGLVDPAAEVWALRETEVAWPPGTRFHYSNAGYKAIGLAIERVCGAPYPQVLAERILDRVGMPSSFPAITADVRAIQATPHVPMFGDRPYRPGHPLAAAPWFEDDGADGSVCATARDLGRYAQTWLRGGATEGGDRLVSPDGFATITTPWIQEGGSPYGYGIGIETTARGVRWVHGGDMVGAVAHLLVDPDAGVAVVAVANGPARPGVLTRFAVDAIVASRAGAPVPPIAPPEAAAPDELRRFAGTYRRGGEVVEVAVGDAGLELAVDGDRLPLAEVDVDAGAFSVDDVRFSRALLQFDPPAGPAAHLWHGARRFDRGAAPAAGTDALRAFEGLYRSNSPWLPAVRFVVRGDRLWMVEPTDGVAAPLVAVADGVFRGSDEPPPPERIRFTRELEGRAMLAELDGLAYHRSWDPPSPWTSG